jgi:hypothetical protein
MQNNLRHVRNTDQRTQAILDKLKKQSQVDIDFKQPINLNSYGAFDIFKNAPDDVIEDMVEETKYDRLIEKDEEIIDFIRRLV